MFFSLSLLLVAVILVPFLFLVLIPLVVPFFQQLLSPLRCLPGPPSQSIFFGNLRELDDQENLDLVRRWARQYGSTFVYRGFLCGRRLLTTDITAIRYILGHAYAFPKPHFVRDNLAAMAAGHHGLLTVEGEDHKRQRRILTPAFSTRHIKSLAPIFWDKAIELRDVWLSIHATKASTQPIPTPLSNDDPIEKYSPPPPVRIDVLVWLTRATLDVIGLAGFGYNFRSLSSASSQPLHPLAATSESPPSGRCDEPDTLAWAFSVIFSAARKFRMITVLQVWIPCLRIFNRDSKTMKQAQATMRRIGLQLIEERMKEATTEKPGMESSCHGEKGTVGGVGEGEFGRSTTKKDLLSVLVRANQASSGVQQMSLEEILCQISTFIAAGHETVGSALTWTLYALSCAPVVQRRLRSALEALPPPPPGSVKMDAFVDALMNDCPYLDWVVRESLRLHSPVTMTMRAVGRDEDVIPLTPGHEVVDKCGRAYGRVRVRKGDIITVPIQAVNRSTEVWGEDATVFRPERWEDPPEEAKSVPGLFSHILTFGNGNGSVANGNRSCIGYRFALYEIKILLYVLIRDLEFTIDPSLVIEKRVNVVTRPFVRSEPELGNQMPLFVRPVHGGSSSSSPPPAVSLAPLAIRENERAAKPFPAQPQLRPRPPSPLSPSVPAPPPPPSSTPRWLLDDSPIVTSDVMGTSEVCVH